MSLTGILKKRNRIKLFTTPSHSGSFCIFPKFKQFYKYDISEVDAYNPQDALNSSQKCASEIYKTKSTHFLINGSTTGIIAAVLSCVEKGDNVLIWDNSHICHKNAVKLAGANPIYYNLEKDSEWGVYKETTVQNLSGYFEKYKIKAVIITSPSYYGICSPVEDIKALCQQFGAYLVVDEAHGALYPFGVHKSAIYSGADFIIQSLHKTAGGLNPTALLHNNTDLDCTKSLEMITTTSPSYALLATIEKNISYLNSTKGRQNIEQILLYIDEMKKRVKNVEFMPSSDSTKIVIKKSGMSGFELSEFLYDNKIEDEKTNEISTMLLCGIGCTKEKLTYLEKVLRKL